MIDLPSLYRPLAAEAGAVRGVRYLLQPEFPLLLANAAFDFDPAAVEELDRRFASTGAPLAFILPEDHPRLEEVRGAGFIPQEAFELCTTQPSARATWAEHVPWSEAWTLSRILTEAYGAPQWRYPFAQALGKALRKGAGQAFIAYLYHQPAGAAIVHQGVGLLLGVEPKQRGKGIGDSLTGRIHPARFLRLGTTATEFPGEVLTTYRRHTRHA
ncbi:MULTISPECIES: hypothetical protein [unclassified Meiothermus]|uniref:hypothetical protein n=1 Tax=unclassified Meiothermus TaxID=370471 RepID=UPI000D7CAE6C|nr:MULTISPECIES: hypothetical protein [unclassified Meiothermus]PZA08838.1 hypothetical protein DNA98_02035 [Meiothermus sp. Pnk-1]RYM36320.1 hypothetical protein EWH23_10360 [Meiothermus sp. PNK-Is4]